MKTIDRRGNEIEHSEAELAASDKHAKRRLASAKRSKSIVVDGERVQLHMRLRGSFSHEQQELLRSIINMHLHGKTYAPETVDQRGMELHHLVDRGHAFDVLVTLDLATDSIELLALAGGRTT